MGREGDLTRHQNFKSGIMWRSHPTTRPFKWRRLAITMMMGREREIVFSARLTHSKGDLMSH